MGPLWLDVEGYELTAEDKEILAHPTVGGVILFSRNYHDNQQLIALTTAMRNAAKKEILIGVDQEGGRVQRFKNGFTRLPAAQHYAQYAQMNKHIDGETLTQQSGWLMAVELMAHNIDLSFAPVLDKGHQSKAITSRSFGEDFDTVVRYSNAFIKGMKSAGMATTGKHFPGHGHVLTDSHLETPVDERDNVVEMDMAIFKAQIEAGILDVMMPAHVIYPHYDLAPASGSHYWLKQILRDKLGFKGLVFSDDLSMEGAAIMGNPTERSLQSLKAGCDMVLMCNNRDSAIHVIDNLPKFAVNDAINLRKKQTFTLSTLQASNEWKQARDNIQRILDALGA